MRESESNAIEAALAAASDAAGVQRLLACLGYEPIPIDATRHDDCTPVARGGGIDVVVVESDEASAVTRAARIRALVGGAPKPILLLWPAGELLTIATGGLDGRPRVQSIASRTPRAAELDTLRELTARDRSAVATLARHARALDRAALTRRFFRDFRAHRDFLSRAWLGLSPRARADRDQLALLFLSRVVFLYFLQRQGHLLGRDDYLITLVRDAVVDASERSIYSRVLRPLFFGVLNRPIDERDADAARLGPLPYLNGGLFEPHALEREHTELDLPDAVVIAAFEQLFERYRFTTTETHAPLAAAAIEPEMLGRMFEGLMASERRERTGTFYTPATVVDRIVRQALQGWLAGRPGMDWRAAGMLLRETAPAYGTTPHLLADVRGLRVIDPACGSGAFVLGALERLTVLRRTLGESCAPDAVRRDLAASSLHGVDVEADAALLCALRIWLALAPSGGATVQPLPNLDHRVRQGDALLDPIDLAVRGKASAMVWRAAALDGRVRRARAALAVLVRRYGSSSADGRERLRARIGREEVRLARRWLLAALERVDASRRQAHARLRSRDLFGDRATDDRTGIRAELAHLRDTRQEIRRLERRLRTENALPFFSFALHFAGVERDAGGGFDLVVSNPPWVRAHRWPRAFSEMIRARYRVCHDGAWRGAASQGRRAPAGQVDLALLFVERGLGLLKPDGVLAMLLPSKSFRSLSAGAARSLVTERSALLSIEDHSLHHRAIFRAADAFAGVVVARSRSATPDATAQPVRVVMTHRSNRALRFRVGAGDLPLDAADPRSPWLIVPPPVRRALRTMQANGRPLGTDSRLRVRRGAMTGANDDLLFERADRKLGDAVIAWPSSTREGPARGSVLLHVDDLCPVVRGSGIRPFRFETDGYVAWCHDDRTARPRTMSARMARHLGPANGRLRARPGWRPGLPEGALFRLDEAMLRPRVAWRDIATDLETARLPARVDALGTQRPLIALNTVYFIALDDDLLANALVGLLSSLPSRVFARSIAERAKDARFRFFAWTVATIPLPDGWDSAPNLLELGTLAERATASAAAGSDDRSALDELDELVASLFRLAPRDLASLRRFDRWLAGAGAPLRQPVLLGGP